jgi:hypothetical protein
MNKLYAALVGLSIVLGIARGSTPCTAQTTKVPFKDIEREARLSANLMVSDAEAAVSSSNEAYVFPSAPSHSLYVRPSYKQPRTLDSKFFVVNGLHLGLAALDVGLTQHCIANHHCREGNPLMPSSFAGQFALDSAFVGTGAFVSYRLKKQNSKLWWLSPVIGISAHTAGAMTGFLNR